MKKEQETLEEAAEDYAVQYLIEDKEEIDSVNRKQAFKDGAKWQQERMYSEEEVFKLICDFNYDLQIDEVKDINEWLENFKKK